MKSKSPRVPDSISNVDGGYAKNTFYQTNKKWINKGWAVLLKFRIIIRIPMTFIFVVYHIYQPLLSGRIWHKVSF